MGDMLIVANWKAYVEDVAKAKKLFSVAKRLSKQTKHGIVLMPSNLHLGYFAESNTSKVSFGAQNVSLSTGGAATGEVTAKMLGKLEIEYSLVGHSERRAMGETDKEVAEKIQHLLANDVTPILCIGERERDAGAEYLSFVRAQIASALSPLTQKERLDIVIAYEPVWAIGKSAADALPEHELMEMVLYIRKVLGEYLPGKAPLKTKILYGGSAEPDNARSLAGGTGIDGFLVGHASVDAMMFEELIEAVS